MLIADEPTTALDVTVQAQILDLLRRLIRDHGMALLLITHDLGVVADMCELTNVMYGGRVVESAPTRGAVPGAAPPVHPRPAPEHPDPPGRTQDPAGDDRGTAAGAAQRAGGLHVRPPLPAHLLERCRTDTPPLDPVAHDHVCACWNP